MISAFYDQKLELLLLRDGYCISCMPHSNIVLSLLSWSELRDNKGNAAIVDVNGSTGRRRNH